ncbi:hypothetical protein K443DRAFT_117919, partial [Laccaria amethystina LaAM-08-1]
KRQEVHVPVFWRYVAFSGLVGPKESRGARSNVPEMFRIFCFGIIIVYIPVFGSATWTLKPIIKDSKKPNEKVK